MTGTGPRVRDVREQRAEADDQLDLELLEEADDQLRERAPAEVRLDPEQQHDVAVEAGRARVVEDGRGPVDASRDPVLERDVRPRRLEVEEVLGLDLGEALRVPELREVAGGERGALAAVVPAAESGDQNRALELRTARDKELLGHTSESRCSRAAENEVAGRTARPARRCTPRPPPRAPRGRARAPRAASSATGARRRPSARSGARA